MCISWTGSLYVLGLLIILLKSNEGYAKKRTIKHDARITNRPDDVPVVKCGGDITLTCEAEGKPAPKIEWWYHNDVLDAQRRKEIVRQAAREGRVKIKTEEMYLVRSTLIIRDAEEGDEGMYQCRASNSPVRENENINIYQHWRIEEVPVNKVMCRDTVLTRTELYPASTYNRSVFEDAVDRAVTSLGLTSSTVTTSTTTTAATPHSRKPTTDPRASSSPMTSSTTIATVRPLKSPKATNPSPNSVEKNVKKDSGRKSSRNVIQKDKKKNENVIGLQQSKNNNNKMSTRLSGTSLEQSGDGGDGNSGLGIYNYSWVMIIQTTTAAFVFLTSYL